MNVSNVQSNTMALVWFSQQKSSFNNYPFNNKFSFSNDRPEVDSAERIFARTTGDRRRKHRCWKIHSRLPAGQKVELSCFPGTHD